MATNAIAGVELGDPDLAAATSAGLDRVEELLHREVTSGYHFVTETSLHLIDAGGKRFRPLFTLLGAQMGPRPNADDVITAAAVVELIHLATLYHDDVMDDATMRRGARARTPAGTTASRSSPATSCSRTPRGWWPTSGRKRCGSSPRRSPSWSPARCARPGARARTTTPSSTT